MGIGKGVSNIYNSSGGSGDSTDISQLEQQILSLNNKVNNLNVDEIKASVNQNTTDIAELQTSVSSNTDDIERIDQNCNANTTYISELAETKISYPDSVDSNKINDINWYYDVKGGFVFNDYGTIIQCLSWLNFEFLETESYTSNVEIVLGTLPENLKPNSTTYISITNHKIGSENYGILILRPNLNISIRLVNDIDQQSNTKNAKGYFYGSGLYIKGVI